MEYNSLLSKTFEWFGHYSAQIIAFSALVFTTYHAYHQRKHQRLSVLPHLTSFTQTSQDNEINSIHMELQNNGLGPAFIENFEVLLDDKPCLYDDAISKLTIDIPCKVSHISLDSGYSIPSDTSKKMISVQFESSYNTKFDEIYKQLNRIDLIIKYKSAYGESYTFSTVQKSTSTP